MARYVGSQLEAKMSVGSSSCFPKTVDFRKGASVGVGHAA